MTAQQTVTLHISNRKGGITVQIPQQEYERQLEQAQALLHPSNAGYLAPVELLECRGLENLTAQFEETNPTLALRRIRRLQAAGIPPLYHQKVPANEFPIIDALIQLPTGKLHQRWTAQHTGAWKKGETEKHPRIVPSTLDDIRDFRTMAFDGEKISEEARKSSAFYLAFKYSRRWSVEQAEQFVIPEFTRLERKLAHLAPNERTYQTLENGLPDLDNLFWHVAYQPADRPSVAREYYRQVSQGEQKRNSKTLAHLKFLFPKLMTATLDDSPDKGYQEEIIKLLAPDRLKEILEDYLVRGLSGMETATLFGPKETIAEILRVSGMQKSPIYRDVVASARLVRLATMSDEDFAALHPQAQYPMSLGVVRSGEPTLAEKEFRDAYLSRYAEVMKK